MSDFESAQANAVAAERPSIEIVGAVRAQIAQAAALKKRTEEGNTSKTAKNEDVS